MSDYPILYTDENLNASPLECNLPPHRPNTIYIFTYSSKSFFLGIYYNYQLFCGKQVSEPVIPDPVTLFAALDKVQKRDFNAINYFGNIDFCMFGYKVKVDHVNHRNLYNWPKTWLSDLHCFRKVYDNFAQNFNSKNLMFK